MRQPYRVRFEQQVRDFVMSLGPVQRSAMKAALKQLGDERGDIKVLGGEMAGWYRLRVGYVRVIFDYRPGREIRCVFAHHRTMVYELFERETIARLKRE